MQCAYERIYYDVLNGQLKSTYPKWEGTSKISDYITGTNSIYDYITINSNGFYWYRENENAICSGDFIYPVSHSFVEKVCGISDATERSNYIKTVNEKLYIGVNSLYNLYNYKNLSGYISKNDGSSDISNIDSAMQSYNSKFIDEFEFYIHVGRGLCQILPLVYFSILLTVSVGAIALLIIYYCNCFNSVNQSFYIIPMHIAWNIIRFFIFSFFMFGFGYGGIFLLAKDAIGLINYIFSDENVGKSSTQTIIFESSTKEFINYCLHSKNGYFDDIFDNKIPNDFIASTLKFGDFINNPPTFDDTYGYSSSYISELKSAYSVNSESELLTYQIVYNSTGSIYSGLDCSFIQNYVNLMRNALYDFSWEVRIMCTLSCFIAFMGAIAVYGYIWTMFLWEKKDNNQGYMYINKSSNNQIPFISSNNKKERKIKSYIPPPKDLNNNNNIEMNEQENNEEEEEE